MITKNIITRNIKELLGKHKVIVPLLQRDYAQGRESEKELRTRFVKEIKDALRNNKPLHLDFVYGYTEPTSSEEAFIPLDGQQRLTTLWLVLWFLAPRENGSISEEYKKPLRNFTYETRLSSRRFCSNLVEQSLEPPKKDLSKFIKDTPWFMASWGNDPTIISMLNMLDTLNDEFKEVINEEAALKNLEEKITFDYIDIKSEDFKLTDELYIKMNSRGRPLTTFENFKAQFSTLLSSNETDYKDSQRDYKDSKISYKEYFAFNIDTTWMDLFWGYRERVEKEKLKTDDCIYNYIHFIAEFLFYKDKTDKEYERSKVNFDSLSLNRVFKHKKNVDFLFRSLDWLSKMEEKKGVIDSFFTSLFDGLSTFDDATKDYFYRAITNKNFDRKDKIILYTVLHYCIKSSIHEVGEELKDLTRIVRNLLFTVRQVGSEKIKYGLSLRLQDLDDYCKFIDAIIERKIENKDKPFYNTFADNEFSGFTKNSIQKEKEKAQVIISNPSYKTLIHRLEEHPEIKGNAANFKLDSEDIKDKIEAFLDIWSDENKTPTHLIIRALLTKGDYAVRTHDYSTLGPIYYFGSKAAAWNRILTNPDKDKNFSNILDSFLSTYLEANGDSASEKLNTIINEYLDDHKLDELDDYDWKYHFIKYESMTNNRFSLNLFTWGDDNHGFNINSLGNSGSHPLHSYHLNPYLSILESMLKFEVTLGRWSEPSFMKIKSGDKPIFRIFPANNNEWKIYILGNYQLDQDLIIHYKLGEHKDGYILKEMPGKDRIETARDFIKDVLKANK